MVMLSCLFIDDSVCVLLANDDDTMQYLFLESGLAPVGKI